VPNAANPQAFNRYSYAYNNPLRYVDPSGHASVCGFSFSDPECTRPDPWTPPSSGGGSGGSFVTLDPGVKQSKPRVYEPVVIEEPEGPTTIQLAQDGISGLYLTIFPEDSTPSVDRTPEQLESAEDWAAWGVAMDFFEGIALAYPGDLFIGEYFMSLGDLTITGRTCYLYGECYVGSPDPSLPPMLVLNQDMMVTGADFVVPIMGGAVIGIPTGGSGFYPGSVASDVVTTGASFFYDLGRITGEIPNGISMGFTLKGDWYILVYP
jgi:hypothetical protein